MTKVYYTGKQCKNGHISYRYVSNRICIACHKIYRRKSYLKNKKRENSLATAWAKKNRKRANELANLNRKKNIKSSSASQKKWRMKNKDKVRGYMANKRAKRAQAVGRFTYADIERLYKRQKAKCSGCHCCIKKKYEIDHIMPLALGGTNWPANLQLLCKPCNSFKRAKHPKQWKKDMKNLHNKRESAISDHVSFELVERSSDSRAEYYKEKWQELFIENNRLKKKLKRLMQVKDKK